METKEEIRKRLLSQRLSLDSEERNRLSRVIQERVLGSRFLERVGTVGLYAPVKNEVETGWIFEELKKRGIRMLYPKVGKDGIEFFKTVRLEDLSPGAWGILEPNRGEKVDRREIDLITLPGLAFDERGHRIGFGKGLFDNFLHGFQGIKVGLSYEFQMLRELPENSGDVRCGWVVTEKRVIRGEDPGGDEL